MFGWVEVHLRARVVLLREAGTGWSSEYYGVEGGSAQGRMMMRSKRDQGPGTRADGPWGPANSQRASAWFRGAQRFDALTDSSIGGLT